MRKIILLQALFMLSQANLSSQSALPYNSTSVRGSTVITNYYDPNAGPNVGPGLTISPLESRLNAPLGTPWSSQATSPNVTATFAAPTFSTPVTYTGPTTVSSVPTTPVTTYGSYPSSNFNSAVQSRFPPRAGNLAGSVASEPLGTSLPQPEPLLPVSGGGVESYGGYPAEPSYLYPGLVRQHLGQWVGSDYLFNMYSNIGVVVEVVTPSDMPFIIDSDILKLHVSEVFANAGINPYAESFLNQPPLPFFYVIILVSQVDSSYVFSISGRFFEAVKISRLNFNTPGTAQAITWEKQELVTTSQSRLAEQLTFTTREIADQFIQRINYFKRLRQEQDDMLKMRCGPVPTVKCPPRLKSMGSRPAFY